MKNHIITFFILLTAISSIIAKPSENKLKHSFMVLISQKQSEPEKVEEALSKLIDGGETTVRFMICYFDREYPPIRDAIEQVIIIIGKEALEPLTEVLAHPNETESSFAAYLLGEIGSKSSGVPLILAAQSQSSKLRYSALGALGNCADINALPVLIDALDDDLPSIRRQAAISLGEIGSNRAVESLIPLFSDSNVFVRYSASYAIANIGDNSVIDILMRRFESDSIDIIEKSHIIETIGMFASEESLPLLFDLLEDPSYLNRGFACQALGYYRGNYKVANALKQSQTDASGFVRMMAGKSLANIGNR
ncbi:HEAT repeat domain-containing protein [bacterium]|nr:HEAT repeat domain-containing protein [bacterium]